MRMQDLRKFADSWSDTKLPRPVAWLVVLQLILHSYLNFDFSFTPYATNVYVRFAAVRFAGPD
jgi:hypothetical protein